MFFIQGNVLAFFCGEATMYRFFFLNERLTENTYVVHILMDYNGLIYVNIDDDQWK